MRQRQSFLHGLLVWVLLISVATVAAQDDCAHVVGATATLSSDGATWTFSATISSPYEVNSGNSGWDKYADEFRIEHPVDGSILGTRTLGHPHVNEQPFTRSVSGIMIPDAVTAVTVSARDSVLGYCGESYSLTIRETDLQSSAPTSGNTTMNSNASGTFTDEDLFTSNATESPVLSIERQHPPVLIIDSAMEEAPLISPAASRDFGNSLAVLLISLLWTYV